MISLFLFTLIQLVPIKLLYLPFLVRLFLNLSLMKSKSEETLCIECAGEWVERHIAWSGQECW